MSRLENANIKSVFSADGQSVLRFESVDSSRDGGRVYSLETNWPNIKQGKLTIEKIIIASMTSWKAQQIAEKNGVDYAGMSLVETNQYLRNHIEFFGKNSLVKEFYLPNCNLSKKEITSLRNIICSLYLKLTASHEFNNDKFDHNHDYYYPDTIMFDPYFIDCDGKVSGPVADFKTTFYAPGYIQNNHPLGDLAPQGESLD